MKSTWIVSVLAAVALNFPVSAFADDTTSAPEAEAHHPGSSAIAASANPGDIGDKWAGTYSSKETNFVTVKRLTFTKENDGSMKIQGVLVGFPDEVSIGEATAEAYADRNNKANPDTIVASFSSERYKPLMVITAQGWDGNQITAINFTCYMKDIDGSRVHVNGYLTRDSDGSNIHISGDLRRDQGGGSGPSPVAMPHGGAPSPSPMPRAGSGAGKGSSPAPISTTGHGFGGGAPAPSPISGGGAPHIGGGGGGRPAAAPAPTRAAHGDGPAASAQADVDFGPYMADLQRRIKRAWLPPKGHEGDRVVVQFRIHKGGELSNPSISHSSGVAIADQAALMAIENSAPFAPLPPGTKENCEFQFTFDYNVFGDGVHGVFRSF